MDTFLAKVGPWEVALASLPPPGFGRALMGGSRCAETFVGMHWCCLFIDQG